MKIHLIGRKPALLLALLLAIVVPVVAYDAEASEVFKVTILHMNDPHAHYEPFRITAKGEPIGGFGKAQTVMASVREECKKEGRHVLTLLAGDLLMGTPYSTVFKGRLGVRLMNDMNFDAMAVGNHEFDYGKTHLLETLRPLARFPLLSANISTDKGERVFEKSIVKEYPGSKTRAIIFGLTTEDTPKITMPDYVKGLVFHDPVKAARELCSELDHGDLVIALTHLGVEADRALAQACPKIDVVIGGHTHTAIPEPEKLGDTLICQAGAYAQYVGRLDVNLVNGKIVNHSGRLISLGPEVEEAPGIASVVADYRRQLDARFGDEVGRTDLFLDGSMTNIRSGRTTNLGALITYAMLEAVGADVALINGGAIRGSLQEGMVTLGDILTVLPFEDTLVKVTLSGPDLEEVLQMSEDLPTRSGGKLQAYGISTELNNGKVKITKIGDRAFHPEESYSVAIDNFLLAGGDGYVIFKQRGQNPQDTGRLVSDVFIDFLKRAGTVTQQTLNDLQYQLQRRAGHNER